MEEIQDLETNKMQLIGNLAHEKIMKEGIDGTTK